MCNCIGMARVPDVETDCGRWPMPVHHQNCEDYRTIKYVRLTNSDGDSYIDIAENQCAFIDSNQFQEEGWMCEDVFLTEDQFLRLPECQGF